jgi:hypothetical protein
MTVELAVCSSPEISSLVAVDAKLVVESLGTEIVVLAAATSSIVGAMLEVGLAAVLEAATSGALLLVRTRVVVLVIVVVVVAEVATVVMGSGGIEASSELRGVEDEGLGTTVSVMNRPPLSIASIAATICSSIFRSSRRNVSIWSFGIVIV